MSAQRTPKAVGAPLGHSDAYRVGVPERQRVLDLLSDALSAQYLTVAEFEQRTAAAVDARTRAELQAVVGDLPPDWIRDRERHRRRQRHAGIAHLAVRLHLAAYLAGSLLMVAIWLAVGVGAGAWYPWPIWPILGWGLGVAGHAVPVSLARRRLAG